MSIHAATHAGWDPRTCTTLVATAARAVNHHQPIDVAVHDESVAVEGIDLPELLHGLDVVDGETRAAVTRVEDAAIINDNGVVQLPEFLWRRWEEAQRQLEEIADLRNALTLARTA